MRGEIFINYRRSISQDFANRLRDALARFYPEHRIFLDTESIEGGKEFPDVLRQKVEASAVLLAVIGPEWSSVVDSDGTTLRLHSEADYVRREITTAFDRGIEVIPVLHEGAKMPGAGDLPGGLLRLASKQGVEIRSSRLKQDVEAELIGLLANIVGPPMRAATWAGVLFNLDGRISRKQFWLGYLSVFILATLVTVLLAVLLGNAGVAPEQQEVVVLIATFPFLWPLSALVIKRAQDFGFGRLVGLMFVALCIAYSTASALGALFIALGLLVVATLLVAVVGCLPGEKEANRFGPVPRDAVG